MNNRVRIKVEKENLQTFVDELKSGKYFLPSFQRRYEWDEDDIKDLIISIIKNQPIGTLILWKPSSKIDPFSKPLIDSKKSSQEVVYVIDGQQRLTSLLLLLNNWEITRGGELIKRKAISYNPSSKRFTKGTTSGIDLSKLIKAFYHYDEITIAELKKKTEEKSYKEMENMIKEVLNKYPIPVYIMETDCEDKETFCDMADAFIKVNKSGIRIGNLELMLSFLAGAVSGDLKNKIVKLYDRLYEKIEIDLHPVIRFAFSNFGLKQTQISRIEQFKGNIEKISKYSLKDNEKIFKKSDKAMMLTMEILKSKLGISDSYLLPSQTSLIPIAKYFYNKGTDSLNKLKSRDIKNIINWFVLTNFNGYYSSHTDTKLDKDLEIIKNSDCFPWKKLVENIKAKKTRIKIQQNDIKKGLDVNVLRHQGRAYLFLLYILLVRNKADDWSGVLIGENNFNELARHHIFPKEYLEQNLEIEDPDAKEVLINNLANITFIQKGINSEIGDKPPEEYMKNYKVSAVKHFIPKEKEWAIDKYDTFLDKRIKEIYNIGKKYFRDIF